jgi:arylsulfatase
MTDDRSVVLVTVDSLRADYCGFMGSNRGLTPNMDRHAAEGLVFENAVTPGPSTLDAMPGIFTGVDLVDSDDGDLQDRLQHHMRAHTSLPERFADAGYETAAFTANPWTSRQFGFDAGFDHFEDFLDGPADDVASRDEAAADQETADDEEESTLSPLGLVRRWAGESSMFQAWGSFADDAVAWAEDADEPYFLWLFLVDVHMPYLPVSGVRSQTRPETYAANLWLYLNGHEAGPLESLARPRLVSAYEDTIRYTDDLYERFVAELADDPLVAFHADHGEAFGEGGVYGHGPSLSEEQVHVPLFVANGPTGRVERPFSLRRLPDLLVALATGEGDVADLTGPYATTRNRDPKFALRGADWKYVDDDGDLHLYDLASGERLAADGPLAAVADEYVRAWQTHERERQRVSEAAREVAETTDC